jgi:hypothetical protein
MADAALPVRTMTLSCGGLILSHFITNSSVVKAVTKVARRKRRCGWCRRSFKPKEGGRPALYCRASCRQRAYEKRKWTAFGAPDALALDLLPLAARRKLVATVRHAHMVELLRNGVVPLTNPAQIDGVLDPATPLERPGLLQRIEHDCRDRGDERAMSVIARWRLAKQQPSP